MGSLSPRPSVTGAPFGFRGRALFAAIVLASWAACAPVARPQDTVLAFRQAWLAGNVEAMHALLSSGAQAELSRADILRLWREAQGDEAERRELLASFDAALRQPARLELGSKERRFALRWDEGARRWTITAAPLSPYDLRSPRGALASFLRAVERRRWDVLLALAPRARRASLDADALRRYWEGRESEHFRVLFPALRAALEEPETHPVFDLGAEAHFPFGTDAEVFLVKEEGLWRIEEIEDHEQGPKILSKPGT